MDAVQATWYIFYTLRHADYRHGQGAAGFALISAASLCRGMSPSGLQCFLIILALSRAHCRTHIPACAFRRAVYPAAAAHPALPPTLSSALSGRWQPCDGSLLSRSAGIRYLTILTSAPRRFSVPTIPWALSYSPARRLCAGCHLSMPRCRHWTQWP